MWYRDGTITFANGSDILIGVDTYWNVTANGVLPGMIVIGPDNKLYEIKEVQNNTSLTLVEAYSGETQSDVPCRIITTYEGDLTQFSARFTALMNRMSADSRMMRSWLTAIDDVTFTREDGTEVTVKSLTQIVNEHNANQQWYTDNTEAISNAGENARQAASSAASAADNANVVSAKASEVSESVEVVNAAKNAASVSAQEAASSASISQEAENNTTALAAIATEKANVATDKAERAERAAAASLESENNARDSKNSAADSKQVAVTAAETSVNAANEALLSRNQSAEKARESASSADTATAKASEIVESANAAKTSENKAKDSENRAYEYAQDAKASVGSVQWLGTTKSLNLTESNGALWVKIARIRMPQATSTVYIELVGSGGFNANTPSQAAKSEIVLRTGNNNPKGVNAVLYRTNGGAVINIATNNTDGDNYEIYVNIGNYAHKIIGNIQSANAAVETFDVIERVASLPTSAIQGVVYNHALVNSAGTIDSNAASATKLQTTRTINGVAFDGTQNITLSPVNIGAPTAIYGQLNTGNGTAFTTPQFVTFLTNKGAFSNKFWIARGSWSYANNNYIDDTGCGRIDLSGAVIEVFCENNNYYTIRITTATTTGHSGMTSAEFIYVNNGSSYAPRWRRCYNTGSKPTPADIGALASGANAVSASKLQTARAINGVAFDGSANISIPTITSRGKVNALVANTQGAMSGIQMYDAYNNGYPTTYGTVLHMKNASSAGEGELLIGWSGTSGAHAPAYIRSRRDTTDANWSGWAQIYTTASKPSAADVGALPLTGGTLTGSLTSNGEIISKSANGLRIAYGNYGFFIRNDGSSTYFMMTASGNQLGSFNGLRPLFINNSTGRVNLGNGADISGGATINGALGIGTTNALGGNSITLGDNDTGFKQNGDGLLDVYANNAHVFRFQNGTMQSHKPISVSGDITSSAWVYANRFAINSSSTSWVDMRNQNVIFGKNAVATSGAQALLRQDHADRKFFLGGLGNSQFGFYMINNSRTANGTDAHAYLQSDGAWYCGGNGNFNDVYIRSDRRNKRNIRKIENALDKIERVEGVLYDIQTYGRYEKSGGLIAQDMLNAQPELVTADNSDPSGESRLRLNYNGVIGMLVEGIKELRREVNQLKENR
ncbi:tail fiber domain-containing protein (plasmid) [Escherichia coli]|nr:tail fiber domain-containing protein [Escherichia coli]